jgi:hypothetical protein
MKKALLIGINYSDCNTNTITNTSIKLNGCIDDIINIQNTLTKYYGYDPTNIVMLRDDSTEHSTLPTKENIIFHLKDIMSSKNDSVSEIWIHYSGHGSQIHNDNTLKSNDIIDIIVPIDYAEAGFISDIDLCDYIKNIESNIPTIMCFDCCHSGSICNMPWSFEYNLLMQIRTKKDSKTILSRTRIDDLNISNQNIYVFSGCRDDQISADSFSREYNQPMGAFTNALNQCLQQMGSDLPIMILYKNICELMTAESYKQTPILSSSCMEPNYKLVKIT